MTATINKRRAAAAVSNRPTRASTPRDALPRGLQLAPPISTAAPRLLTTPTPTRRGLGHAAKQGLQTMPLPNRRPNGEMAWTRAYLNALVESALARRMGERVDDDVEPFERFAREAIEAIEAPRDGHPHGSSEDWGDDDDSEQTWALERARGAFRGVVSQWSSAIESTPGARPVNLAAGTSTRRKQDPAEVMRVTLILRARMFHLIQRALEQHDRSTTVARLRLTA